MAGYTDYTYTVKVRVDDDDSGDAQAFVTSEAGDIGDASGTLGADLGSRIGNVILAAVHLEHFGEEIG